MKQLPKYFDEQHIVNSAHRKQTHSKSGFELFQKNPLLWFDKQMNAKIFNYTTEMAIETTFLTYNVGECFPEQIDVNGFITDSDLVVIALEEIDMSVSGIMTQNSSELSEKWKEKFSTALSDSFQCIKSYQLGGLFFMMFAKEEVSKQIRDVLTTYVPLGTLGMLNKGGIAMSFRIGISRILIVACHLNAGQGRARCDEDVRILKEQFQLPYPSNEYDYEIYLGDMNYRIDSDIEDVRNHINDINYLLSKDQLLKSLKEGTAFNDFIEPPITFQPTYRYIKGTDTYSPQRIPAWCDRVLFRVVYPFKLSMHSYKRINTYVSDHVPVKAQCTMKPRIIGQDLLKKAWDEVLSQSNDLAMQLVPSCTFSNRRLNFNQERPFRQQTQSITITNDGKIPIKYLVNCISLKTGQIVYPKWLRIIPEEGCVPVDNTHTLSFTIIYNAESSDEIKEHNDLVCQLTIENGSVYYIEIIFDVASTSFGKSLEDLQLHKEPFLKLQSSLEFTNTTIPKEMLLFITKFKQEETNERIFTTLPSVQNYPSYESIFLSVDAMKELDSDICYISESFILTLNAMNGLFTPLDVLFGGVEVMQEISSPVRVKLLRIILALCKEIHEKTTRSLEELLSYFIPPIFNYKTDLKDEKEILNAFITLCDTIKSVDEELSN